MCDGSKARTCRLIQKPSWSQIKITVQMNVQTFCGTVWRRKADTFLYYTLGSILNLIDDYRKFRCWCCAMSTAADRNWASSDPDNKHILRVEYRAATDIYGIDQSVPARYISSQKKVTGGSWVSIIVQKTILRDGKPTGLFLKEHVYLWKGLSFWGFPLWNLSFKVNKYINISYVWDAERKEDILKPVKIFFSRKIEQ